jgi:hypothetical protein
MIPRRLALVVVVVLAASVVAAGCGDDDGEPITFGEGEIPRSFPDDFPVPPGAVIGSTLVDRVSHRSEFALGAPQDATATVQFFLVELVNEGYVVESSEGSAAQWFITFSKGDLTGEVSIRPGGSATQAVVSINRS